MIIYGEKINNWILIVIGIIAILVLVGIIVTIVVLKKKKDGKIEEPNYQAFFSFGIIWIPIGIVFMITIHPAAGMAFVAMGIVYMAIGLANRDKWEKKEE